MHIANWRVRAMVASVATFITLVAASVTAWNFIEIILNQGVYAIMAVAYALLVSFLVMCVHLVMSLILHKRARYANVSQHIHRINHTIRDVLTYLDKDKPISNNKEEIVRYQKTARDMVGRVLDTTVSIFEQLTRTKCRACIKLIYSKPSDNARDVDLYFRTYIRDQNSDTALRMKDEERREGDVDPLSVRKNRVFYELFDPKNANWYYMHNNLRKAARKHEFITTSFTAYDPQWGERRNRFASWPLPYSSTITCVIRQGGNPPAEQDYKVLGFLAIDSESRGVFNERWDIQLALSIADALFHPLEKISEALGIDLE